MPHLPLIPCILLIAFCCPASTFGQRKLPRFEDYPVRQIFNGKPTPLRLDSPIARRYRTMLRQDDKRPANFAGHYRITEIGCGSDCNFIFVVDVRTGKVYDPGVKLNYDSTVLREKEVGRAYAQYRSQYRLDSKLLISLGQSEALGRGLFFYKWEGSRFRLIHKLAGKD